jgi:hypothetical protein
VLGIFLSAVSLVAAGASDAISDLTAGIQILANHAQNLKGLRSLLCLFRIIAIGKRLLGPAAVRSRRCVIWDCCR